MTATRLDAALPHPTYFPDRQLNTGLLHLNRVVARPNVQIGNVTCAGPLDAAKTCQERGGAAGTVSLPRRRRVELAALEVFAAPAWHDETDHSGTGRTL